MNIGFSLDDFVFVFVLCFAALFVPLVLLGMSSLIGRIIGLRSGWFTLVCALLVGAGVFYGSSLYLDTAGKVVSGRVVSKDETIRIREEGDWRHTLQTSVRYRLDGGPLTDDSVAAPSDSTTGLWLNDPQFDALREHDTVALRVLPVWHSIALVRLANLRTRDLVPITWLLIGAAILMSIWLMGKISRTRVGFVVIALVVLVLAVAVPSVVTYQQWRAMEDLDAKPLRAQATVSDVQRITHIDPLPCHNGDCSDYDTAFDVSQQYDIVQFTFTPQNARDSVIGVDAADAGTFNGRVGSVVDIAYNAADPRAAQLLGATHTHH